MGLTAAIGSLREVVMRSSLLAALRRAGVGLRDHGSLAAFTCKDADSRPARRQCPAVQLSEFGRGSLSLHCSNAVSYRVGELTRRTGRHNFLEIPAGVPR